MTAWTQLTDKTAMPKLTWLIKELKGAGIETRLNGESFEAPILEVPEGQFNDAWTILGPIDGLAVNDAMFTGEAKAWWADEVKNTPVANLVAAIGLMANQIRRQLAENASCIPEGADQFSCPLSTGLIETCPAAMWSICKPMVRLESFGIGLSERMEIDDEKVMTAVNEIVAAIGREVGADNVIAILHALAILMTQDGLEFVATTSAIEGALAPEMIVQRALEECMVTTDEEGKKVLATRVAEVGMDDAIRHGFDPELN